MLMFLASIVLALTLKTPAPMHRHRAHHAEICPGAVYFIKHGERAAWTKHKRLLCVIGDHDFYGDLPRPKGKKR